MVFALNFYIFLLMLGNVDIFNENGLVIIIIVNRENEL